MEIGDWRWEIGGGRWEFGAQTGGEPEVAAEGFENVLPWARGNFVADRDGLVVL